MKFMQRTKEKIEKDLEEQQSKALLDEEYNENMRKEGQKFVVDNSYLFCEELVFGRMSFKGMNPEVEKLMQDLSGNSDKNEEKSAKNDESVDVNDEEMTNRYSHYVDSNHMNRKRHKFSKQNHRSDKRFKH